MEVKIFGQISSENSEKLTKEICNIYEEVLGIPQNKIYIKYEEVSQWGWNGNNL